MRLAPPSLWALPGALTALEVGQLLLQQEQVGFELIPLLKDLLNLLSTEAHCPALSGSPEQRGIRLWKDRLGQWRLGWTGTPWAVGTSVGQGPWEDQALPWVPGRGSG